MYEPPPKVDTSLGLTAADFPKIEVGVWPENWPALTVFDAMSTQWRMGPAGPTGLDYGPLPWVMDTRGIPKKDRASVFDDVRVMELAALEQIGQT
jgi:hypothetical protein